MMLKLDQRIILIAEKWRMVLSFRERYKTNCMIASMKIESILEKGDGKKGANILASQFVHLEAAMREEQKKISYVITGTQDVHQRAKIDEERRIWIE